MPAHSNLAAEAHRRGLKPIERVSRSEATGEGIKNLILSQNLKPGDPLPSEQVLIDTLGVSRSSVREAVRHLQALDIVTVKQGSGTFVGSLSMDPLVEALAFRAMALSGSDQSTLAEVVEIRHILDAGTGKLVCAAFKGTTQPELADIVDQMVAQADSGHMFTDLDYAFHDTLLAKAGNEVVRQLVNSLWRVHQIVLPHLSPEVITSRLAETARAHGAMLEAACAGDVEAYQQAVAIHYRPIEDILATERQR
ncbi:MAG: FadR/GntR family transcriptional regulator [Actinomycetaceae bacterium]|nr:FadR/GntR family transcriptional regulator [Actinomycetaceae bacterium]MDU0970728.1 FadR/GntR family transcriptional regulator [Actinomycetaceae bacterium]